MQNNLRHDWSLKEAEEIFSLPFPELMFRAQATHRENFNPLEVQRSTLLSIKTGGCPENCGYCPQSAHHDADSPREKLLAKDVVLEKAKAAKAEGSTRFCMGAAWRDVPKGKEFDEVLDIVKGVSGLGLEVCCTLGMLNKDQAQQLKEAGCYAYNHNLDTSREYYKKIVQTRTFDERLETLHNVRDAGMTVCCGGIMGMGETNDDRLKLLLELANLNPHPDSVPINMLVRVKGTPLADALAVDPIEFVRVIATARIMMPKSFVRLSAGRTEMSDEMQALCLLAGANSIFAGEKLLTTPNPGETHDRRLMQELGMNFMEESAHGH